LHLSTESVPPSLFSHYGRADEFIIPFDDTGLPMTVGLTVVSKSHPWNWVLLEVHPTEQQLPPEPDENEHIDAALGCDPQFVAELQNCFSARLQLSRSGSRYTVGAEPDDDQDGLPSGTPAAGATLTLVAAPVSLSGGHAHDRATRPRGTFFGVARASPGTRPTPRK
jgi:hypothetical protein